MGTLSPLKKHEHLYYHKPIKHSCLMNVLDFCFLFIVGDVVLWIQLKKKKNLFRQFQILFMGVSIFCLFLDFIG